MFIFEVMYPRWTKNSQRSVESPARWWCDHRGRRAWMASGAPWCWWHQRGTLPGLQFGSVGTVTGWKAPGGPQESHPDPGTGNQWCSPWWEAENSKQHFNHIKEANCCWCVLPPDCVIILKGRFDVCLLFFIFLFFFTYSSRVITYLKPLKCTGNFVRL